MTTKVEKSVVVEVPVSTAYNQWTQFEEFPRFMSGIERITQLADDRLEWVAEIAGVRRQWIAQVLEQVPDRKVAWAAVEGATNAGAVTFSELGPARTEVHLSLEYEPEGLLEGLADKLNLVAGQAKADLERFKEFIESQGSATGGWRGTVHASGSVGTPGVEDAASSIGDSGKVTGGGPARTLEGTEEPVTDGLASTPPGAVPPGREKHPLNDTDAASGFGDPDRETSPGVTRPESP